MIVRFRVHGDPKGQPRARAFAMKIGDKYTARMFDAGTAEGWKGLVAVAAKPFLPASPIDVPVTLSATFLFKRPARLSRKRDPIGRIPFTAKPDRDNLDKAILDSLTQLGFFRDDALVYGGTIYKYYVAWAEAPGAEIEISWPT